MSDFAELEIRIVNVGVTEGNVALKALQVAADGSTAAMAALLAGSEQTSARFKAMSTDALSVKNSVVDFSNELELASRHMAEHGRNIDALRRPYQALAAEMRLVADTQRGLVFSVPRNPGGFQEFGPQQNEQQRLRNLISESEAADRAASGIRNVEVATGSLTRSMATGLRPGIILATASLAEMGERGGRVIGTMALATSRLAIFGFSSITAAIVAVVFALELWQDKTKDGERAAERQRVANEKWAQSLDDLVKKYQDLERSIKATEQRPESVISIEDRIKQLQGSIGYGPGRVAADEERIRRITEALQDPQSSDTSGLRAARAAARDQLEEDRKKLEQDRAELEMLTKSILPAQKEVVSLTQKKKEAEDRYNETLKIENERLKEQKEYQAAIVESVLQGKIKLIRAQAEIDAAGDPNRHNAGIYSAQAQLRSAETALASDFAARGQFPEGADRTRGIFAADATRVRLVAEVDQARALVDLAKKRAEIETKLEADKKAGEARDKQAARDLENSGREQMRVEQQIIDDLEEQSKIRKQQRDLQFSTMEIEAEKQSRLTYLKNGGFQDELQLSALIVAKKKEIAFVTENEYKDHDEIIEKLNGQLERYQAILGVVKEIHQEQLSTVSGRREQASRDASRVFDREDSGTVSGYAGDFREGFAAQNRLIQNNLLTTREIGAASATSISTNFANAFDVIANRSKSASEQFRQFTVSVLSDLSKIFAQRAALGLVSSIFSGFGGGGSSSSANSAANNLANQAEGEFGGGGVVAAKSLRRGDSHFTIINVRDEHDADTVAAMKGAQGSEAIVMKGSGQPGVSHGTLTAGRRR